MIFFVVDGNPAPMVLGEFHSKLDYVCARHQICQWTQTRPQTYLRIRNNQRASDGSNTTADLPTCASWISDTNPQPCFRATEEGLRPIYMSVKILVQGDLATLHILHEKEQNADLLTCVSKIANSQPLNERRDRRPTYLRQTHHRSQPSNERRDRGPTYLRVKYIKVHSLRMNGGPQTYLLAISNTNPQPCFSSDAGKPQTYLPERLNTSAIACFDCLFPCFLLSLSQKEEEHRVSERKRERKESTFSR
jgi:hypothetical protein